MKRYNNSSGKIKVLIAITSAFILGSFALYAGASVTSASMPINDAPINELIGFGLVIGSLIGVNELLIKERKK